MKYSKTMGLGLISTLILLGCGSDSDDSGSSSGENLTIKVGKATTTLNLQEDADKEKAAQVQQCASAFADDIPVDSFKVAGSESEIEVEPVNAVALKITGNQNKFNLNIVAEDGVDDAKFHGVCFVLSGNQPTVTVNVDNVALKKFKVIATGNQGKVDVTLKNGAAIEDEDVNTSGNKTTVTVTKETETE